VPVVDTLITRYEADTRDYVAGAARVDKASAAMGRNIGRSIGSGVVALGALGVGLAATGFEAMKSAASFDTMTRKFAGAFGSMEAARSVMEDLERAATKSAFPLEALADAASMLAVAGLDVQRFLPLVERFALVVSGVDPQGLKQVAGALMRAKGGAFGEALEVFRRAGVGAPELKAQGLGITAGGQVKGSPDDFFRALEGASEPLKRIAEAVSGGDETKLSNVGDAVGRSFRVLGAELNERFMPAFVEFSESVSGLVEDGTVEIIANQFANAASSLAGGGGLADAADSAATALFMVGKWSEAFGDTMKMVSESPIWKHLGLAAGPVFGPAAAVAGPLWHEFWQSAATELELGKPTRPKGGSEPPSSSTREAPGLAAAPAKSEQHLAAIEENTRRMVEMQRIVLGGGALGASGVSAVRVAGMRKGGGGGGRVARAIGLLYEEFADFASTAGVAAR